MTRRINLIGVCIVSSLCILLLLASHKFSSVNYKLTPDYHKLFPSGSTARPIASGPTKSRVEELDDVEFAYINDTFRTQNEIINYQSELISREMQQFEYPNGQNDNFAVQLTDLTPETDGTPFRSVLITTWRSGSTFLGDVLNAMPGNFYHYEPLLNYDIVQIRGPPLAANAVGNLKKLLRCEFSDLEDYLVYGKMHNWLFTHNVRLWDACGGGNICWDPKFLNEFCKLFPLQSMKVVRLRLAPAAELLEDITLKHLRLILLIRDPRGALQSRRHRDWCPGNPDCDNASNVCNDMIADFKAAKELQKKYPDNFRAIRYEDLALDPWTYVGALFKFLGLPMTKSVEKFLESHTTTDKGGVSSTYRNSKTVPFHWKQEFKFPEVQAIQQGCTEALSMWGYKLAHSEEDLLSKEWSPLGELNDKDIGLLIP